MKCVCQQKGSERSRQCILSCFSFAKKENFLCVQCFPRLNLRISSRGIIQDALRDEERKMCGRIYSGIVRRCVFFINLRGTLEISLSKQWNHSTDIFMRFSTECFESKKLWKIFSGKFQQTLRYGVWKMLRSNWFETNGWRLLIQSSSPSAFGQIKDINFCISNICF